MGKMSSKIRSIESTNIQNRRIIFLSHSSENQDEAKIIYDFLNFVISSIPKLSEQFEVFFAPISLPKSYEDSEWQNTLIKKVGESYSFISYCTTNSLTSRWSNFEIGVAYDRNYKLGSDNLINIAPIASSCIKLDVGRSILESKVIHFINPVPSAKETIIDSIEDVKNWLNVVFKGNDSLISQWCLSAENQKRIIEFKFNLCERIAYVVGSEPKSNDTEKAHWDSAKVRKFVLNLCEGILQKGFSLASSPGVPNVGSIVAKAAYNQPNVNRYKILGLYKLEQVLTEEDASKPNVIRFWKEMIRQHRSNYLNGISTYIILGGNENTTDEYNELIKNIHVIILPLPCFGGFSKRLFQSMNEVDKIKHPCKDCCSSYSNCPKIGNLVEYATTYRASRWTPIQ